MKSWRRPGKICEILEKALESWDLGPKLRRYEAAARWDEIAGPQIAARSQSKGMQGDVLVVEVDHPAWVQELNLMKGLLLKKLQSEHPRARIRDLKFILK